MYQRNFIEKMKCSVDYQTVVVRLINQVYKDFIKYANAVLTYKHRDFFNPFVFIDMELNMIKQLIQNKNMLRSSQCSAFNCVDNIINRLLIKYIHLNENDPYYAL